MPYPVESQLSGLERHEDHMFYRKLVTVPKSWSVGKRSSDERLKLNFGAVDYQARVWVNGKQVAEHTGGYTAFSADITDALKGSGPQEIVVAVTDTTGADQPTGKQSANPGGIVYTAVLRHLADRLDGARRAGRRRRPRHHARHRQRAARRDGQLRERLEVAPRSPRSPATRRARSSARSPARPTASCSLPIAKPAPVDARTTRTCTTWTSPSRTAAPRTPSTATSACAPSASQKVGGYQKLVLNGKPIFSLATLDQGFWPGRPVHRSPATRRCVFDLKAQKELGFNAVRKHIKVEPARWYYHADQLGLLVWQDFVSADIDQRAGPAGLPRPGPPR